MRVQYSYHRIKKKNPTTDNTTKADISYKGQ